MNISTRKLFASQKSNAANFVNPLLLDIPERKTFHDILSLFQQAINHNKSIESYNSLDNFINGYNALIDFRLKDFERLQRKILTRGMADNYFSEFLNIANTQLADTDILETFGNNIFAQSEQFAFLAGYKSAAVRILSICHYIINEMQARGLSKSCVYTNFWDFTATEKFLLEQPMKSN